MRKAILGIWLAIAAGCVGGSTDPVDSHRHAVVASGTLDDVDELGVDEEGCEEAVASGGQALPIDGRPDLVGVAIDGAVVCVTTVELASAAELEMSWLVDHEPPSSPMSGDGELDGKPEPEPYDADEADAADSASKPEPEPYDPEVGEDAENDDSSDSQ